MSIGTELFDLTGKVAIITGSSKGIGRAMATAMAEHGAKVVISSRKGDTCEAVAADINTSFNCRLQRLGCGIGVIVRDEAGPNYS